jgi:leucyl aminopeptidase
MTTTATMSEPFFLSAAARGAPTEIVPKAPANADGVVLLRPTTAAAWQASSAAQDNDPARALAADLGFSARHGEVLLVPGQAAGAKRTLFLGLGALDASSGGDTVRRAFAAASAKTQQQQQQTATTPTTTIIWERSNDPVERSISLEDASEGWYLGSYVWDRFKSSPRRPPFVPLAAVPAAGEDLPALREQAERGMSAASLHCWARDLTNCPASDLPPRALAAEAETLATLAALDDAARITLVKGDALLTRGWPLVHAVGRASRNAPMMVDLAWQPSSPPSSSPLPLVVLCGKGVCFDSGGLSIKTNAGMRLMKKDMGGAALSLALAGLVMRANLPVRLRVLIPCVENSIDGNANRPGDVLRSRLGLTVEQLNTDAEGRLILADALTEACGPDAAAPWAEGSAWGHRDETEAERLQRWRSSGDKQRPDLVIDAATLTGAARVALGPELPAVFCNDDAAWAQLERAAREENDPLWRLPLHQPYSRLLDSKTADLSNVAGGDATGQAGAVVAALFLERFVNGAAALAAGGGEDGSGSPSSSASVLPPPWIHIDTAGWVFGGSASPGRPEGGEPLALRALWRMLRERYAPSPSSA